MRCVLLVMVCLIFTGCAAGPAWKDWAAREGGVMEGDSREVRAAGICARLAAGMLDRVPPVHILDSDTVGAYAFPEGVILLTRGLVERADDEELAAAIAHEMGHLLSDGHIHGMVALHGGQAGADEEARADAMGCAVLAAHGIGREAMARMLGLVAEGNWLFRGGLERRIRRLRAAD